MILDEISTLFLPVEPFHGIGLPDIPAWEVAQVIRLLRHKKRQLWGSFFVCNTFLRIDLSDIKIVTCFYHKFSFDQ